jgi:hypothetical protein
MVTVERRQSSPIRSFLDLPHVCKPSRWITFRDYQICFFLPLTLSPFGSLIFLIPRTFHPKRWSPSSVLSSLRKLCVGFQSYGSGPDWEGQQKRSILPVLRELYFKGVSKYLAELVTHIDTPQLHYMDITFFYQHHSDTPRLTQFINCTPTLRSLDKVQVQCYDHVVDVILRSRTSEFRFDKLLISILCSEPYWQRSSVELCNSSLHPLSTVEHLYIEYESSRHSSIENTLWLELLLPFTAVKNLYLYKEFAPGIAATLRELVGDRITEVLPSLQNIFVEGLRVDPSGPFQENIAQFIAARRHSEHPIAISDWDKDSDMEWM